MPTVRGGEVRHRGAQRLTRHQRDELEAFQKYVKSNRRGKKSVSETAVDRKPPEFMLHRTGKGNGFPADSCPGDATAHVLEFDLTKPFLAAA